MVVIMIVVASCTSLITHKLAMDGTILLLLTTSSNKHHH
jgi:hypothetical protein